MYLCRPQPGRLHLPFKIIYTTNIMLVLKSWSTCANHTHKPLFTTVLLAIVFNVFLEKGDQTARTPTRGMKTPPDLVTRSRYLVSMSSSHVLIPVLVWVAALFMFDGLVGCVADQHIKVRWFAI